MASHRVEKINVQIQRELSLIIRQKIRDQRLNRDGLSITKVKATPDLKYATVYFSVLGKDTEKETALEVLDRAKGFLRSELGRSLKTHTVPALTFKIDDSVDYSMKIEAILADLKKDGHQDEQ